MRPEDQEGALWERLRGGLAVEITHLGQDRYTAAIIPPAGIKPFKIARRLSAWDLMRELLALGCHPADIEEALIRANPKWTRKS